MYWDAKLVKPLPDYKIYVELENDKKGIFDMKPYLNHGVFRELKNVQYFNQVDIVLGAVTWPNEQDIAPETLLTEMTLLELQDVPMTGGASEVSKNKTTVLMLCCSRRTGRPFGHGRAGRPWVASVLDISIIRLFRLYFFP